MLFLISVAPMHIYQRRTFALDSITCVWHTCICTTYYKKKSTFRSCLYLEKIYTSKVYISNYYISIYHVSCRLHVVFALCRCPQAHIVARLILSYFWKKSRIFCRYNSGATYGLQRCLASGMMTSSLGAQHCA